MLCMGDVPFPPHPVVPHHVPIRSPARCMGDAPFPPHPAASRNAPSICTHLPLATTGMFNDPDFQTQARVDKRGRKVGSGKRGEDLKRYYHLKDEDGEVCGTACAPGEGRGDELRVWERVTCDACMGGRVS
eukprot:359710-Chlamydomonas_euryale.AAC.8